MGNSTARESSLQPTDRRRRENGEMVCAKGGLSSIMTESTWLISKTNSRISQLKISDINLLTNCAYFTLVYLLLFIFTLSYVYRLLFKIFSRINYLKSLFLNKYKYNINFKII